MLAFCGATVRVLTISKPYVAAAYRQKLTILAEQGFTVGLICPPAWGSQVFEPDAEGDQYWLKRLPIVANGKNHLHFYRGLTAAVREFKPDIINCEEEHYSLVTRQCLQAAESSGAKFLFYTWQNIYKKYPPPFSWTEQAVLNRSAAAVTGNDEATQVLRVKGYRGHIAEIPQMGVNFDWFAAQPADTSGRRIRKRDLGLEPDAFHIGFAGRLVEEKGLDTLLSAAAQALKQVPRLRLVILGSGPHLPQLQAQSRALGIENRISWHMQVPSTAVATYLKALDVLCLPSRTRSNWKEQFGRILVEAMAASAIVVGSSSGEIPRVIADAGLIFPEGDSDSLARHLVNLAQDENLQLTLRERGSRRAQKHYTNTVVASLWGDLWRHVAAESDFKSR